jgi:hypothetical protein
VATTEGALAKLKIEAYTDRRLKNEAPVPSVVVPINPAKYTRNGVIKYTDLKAAGSAGASAVFDTMERETVSFELVFDGTGVVPPPPSGGAAPGGKRGKRNATNLDQGVAGQIKNLKMVAYAYNSKTHEPHYLKLTWGTFSFKCRLKKLDLTYTLFAPDGAPLRARANTTFEGYTDEYILQAMMNRNSPDLTHVLTVQVGDTLPLMCHRIYGHSRYYGQVAEANGLTGFRDLEPGMQLIFPPLAGPA